MDGTVTTMKIITKHNQNSGSALLIAVLVSAVVLSVGIGVFQRTYKELLFSAAWKQTQFAFSAADSGIECGIYWDLHPTATASCFGTAFTWGPVPSEGTWSINRTVGASCVNIEITKAFSVSQNRTITTINSRGYNDACGSANPRRVERGLSVSY